MDTSLPKVKMAGQGSFQPPTPLPLTSKSEVGQYVTWDGLTRSYAGILKEWDSNVAIVQLPDGTMKAVET
jgi:hypothetical protein